MLTRGWLEKVCHVDNHAVWVSALTVSSLPMQVMRWAVWTRRDWKWPKTWREKWWREWKFSSEPIKLFIPICKRTSHLLCYQNYILKPQLSILITDCISLNIISVHGLRINYCLKFFCRDISLFPNVWKKMLDISLTEDGVKKRWSVSPFTLLYLFNLWCSDYNYVHV